MNLHVHILRLDMNNSSRKGRRREKKKQPSRRSNACLTGTSQQRHEKTGETRYPSGHKPRGILRTDSIFILLFTVLLPVPQKVEWQSERFTALTVELTDILQRCFDPQPGLVTPAELFEALGPRIVRRLDLHGDE